MVSASAGLLSGGLAGSSIESRTDAASLIGWFQLNGACSSGYMKKMLQYG